LFDDNSKGLSYYFSSKPTIDECVITGNTHGIYLDYYSAPSIVHCINSATYDGDITGNGAGISCTNSSSPYVGSCNISSNGTGVGVFEDSAPDLDGYGANKFMSNTSYHIANTVFGTTVQATGSYWYTNSGSPNYYPAGSKILGSVNYSGALSSGPNPVSPRPEPKPQPEVVVTGLGQPHPNPFNPTIQIPFGVANPMDVSIEVFDVNGRLVRTLQAGRKERGNHVVVWDGTTNNGSPTASSVYFVRMRAGRLSETQKIVLLK
jgi:parallel beta-helix repeat protein